MSTAIASMEWIFPALRGCPPLSSGCLVAAARWDDRRPTHTVALDRLGVQIAAARAGSGTGLLRTEQRTVRGGKDLLVSRLRRETTTCRRRRSGKPCPAIEHLLNDKRMHPGQILRKMALG